MRLTLPDWLRLTRPRPAPRGAGGASAYHVAGTLVICAISDTRSGVHVDDGPRHSPPADDPAAVGRAVLQALSEARVRLPDLRWGESLMGPTLEAAGVGPRRFDKVALHVDVQWSEGRLVFTPSENRGAKGGFVGLTDRQVLVAPDDPEAVGRALLQAFARSR